MEQHLPMGKLVFGGDDAANAVSDDQFKVTARGVVHLLCLWKTRKT